MEPFAAKSHAEFLRMLRVREAIYNPPLVLMEDAALPLAHREVEAEGIHESTMRARALGRWDRDLVCQLRSIVVALTSPFLRTMGFPH